MKKTRFIFLISVLFLLCACSGSEETYQYSQIDVSADNEAAQSLYDSGNYEESLEMFLDVMQKEPKDVTARIGVVKSQIALENYDMALMNLNMAVPVLAHEEELYELYLQISELTDNISVAKNAVNLAKRYGEKSFLERVPQKPVLEVAGGKYEQKMEVSVTAPDADNVEIYISVDKKDGYRYNDVIYCSPWIMTTGETKLSAYCVKDGVPSDIVEATYICEYEPTTILFADSVMEKLVRNTIGRQEGEITDLDCEQINQLSSYDLQSGEVDYEEYQKMKIKSLEDLQYFPNLTSLTLVEQAEIADYSQVRKCPLLNDLNLRSDSLSDISFMTELPYLSYLYLENNEISDLQPILQCKNLRGLEIAKNPVDDLSRLMQMPKLYMLRIEVGQFKDLTVLEQFENLTDVSIYCTGKDDLSFIRGMKKLDDLSILYEYWNYDKYEEDDFITDISFLENLTNLSYLSISGLRDLSQIDCLKNLTKLQNLYLYNRYDTEDSEKDAEAVRELQEVLPNCSISY